MKHMKSIIIFQLTFFISTLSSLVVNAATPSLPSITGTLNHGGVVTVTGSGFGVKSPVAPLLWDSVDGMYTGITNGSTVPVGAGHPWAEQGGAEANTMFKTTNPRGKWTAKYTNQWSTSQYKHADLGGNNYPGSQKLYISYWMWLSSTGNVGTNKWLRLTDDAGWSDTVRSVIATPRLLDIYDATNGNDQSFWDAAIPGKVGVWQRLEFVVDNTATPIHPKVWQYLDNEAVGQSPMAASFGLTTSITGVAALGADFTNAAASDQPTLDWGEVYVDNTRARVEICNSSTKAASTHCEIQIPQTIWIDNQIQIEVNQGSFPDNSSAYLYVIDAGGNASPGKQITFGSSGNGSTTISLPPSPDFKIVSVTP